MTTRYFVLRSGGRAYTVTQVYLVTDVVESLKTQANSVSPLPLLLDEKSARGRRASHKVGASASTDNSFLMAVRGADTQNSMQSGTGVEEAR
jgi:hypothetical protein